MLVTVPLPVPASLTVRVKVCRSKVAVTVVALVKVTVHEPVPVQPPLQPVKTDPGAGGAVKVTAARLADGQGEGLQLKGGGGRGGARQGHRAGTRARAAATAPASEGGAGGRRGCQDHRRPAGVVRRAAGAAHDRRRRARDGADTAA